MKSIYLLFFLIPIQIFGQQAKIPKPLEPVDSLMNTALVKYNIPGAVLIMIKNDSIIFSKGYGYANLENNTLFDPVNTVVRCGSVSKTLTATAAMLLVERGKLDLNSPISHYLSAEELEKFGIYGKSVTTHQLLTHSAGFDEKLFGSHVESYEEWMDLEHYFTKYPLKFRSEPGQILNYNDQGISLAGYIIAKIEGKPFYIFAEENIFKPLGMKYSSFNPRLSAEIEKRLAFSYNYNGKEFTPYNYDYIFTYPAAGLVSTPHDMAKFLKMQLGSGTFLLSDNSLKNMQSQQFTNHPKLRGWCYGFAEWKENGERFIFKDGQATGFNSRLFLNPEGSWGFYLVWNKSIFNKGGEIDRSNNLKREVTSLLIDILVPETITTDFSKPKPVAASKNYNFEGTYLEMSIGIHDWSKFITLALQRNVEKGQDSRWNIMGGNYLRVDDLLFQWAEGGEFFTSFSTGPTGRYIEFAHQGTGSYEKVPGFENQTIQIILLALLHLTFLLSILVGLSRYLKNKNVYFLGYAFAALLCFIGLPLFGWSLLSVDFQDLYKGPTALMYFASWLPFLGSLLLILTAWQICRSNRKNWLIALTVINILVVPYFLYWNFPII